VFESAYKDLQLSNKFLTEDELIKAMLNHPILIERPIVRTVKGVVIGRPPENVQSIL
jgi:arsenate reductase